MTKDEIIKVLEKKYLDFKNSRENCKASERYLFNVKIADFGYFLQLLKELDYGNCK